MNQVREQQVAEEKAAKKSRSKFGLVWLVLVTLVVGMGVGTFVLADYKARFIDGGMAAWFAPEPVVAVEPQFKPLEQFVIGLPSLERNHYMVLELALMSRYPDQLVLWDTVLPALRNTTLSYFSSFDHQQVQEHLQDLSHFEQELQTALNDRLSSYEYDPSVEAVLITKLVIQ